MYHHIGARSNLPLSTADQLRIAGMAGQETYCQGFRTQDLSDFGGLGPIDDSDGSAGDPWRPRGR